jgi:hypothetical protein
MDPLTLMLIGTGVAKAGAGIAQGVGTARAGKKMMLTPAQQRELDDLTKRQRSGELGLTEQQRGGVEQRFLAEQSGAQRELQAQGLQEAAARGASGGYSGRDLFLREQAGATAALGMRQQQNQVVNELDAAQADADRARIDAMRAQQREAEAMRAQGIAQAVSGGLAGAGEAATGAAGMMQQTKLAEIDAAARAESAASLLNRYKAPPAAGYGFTFGAPSSPTPRAF